MSGKRTSEEDACDESTVTANAAEFQLPNGILMVGIFHVRCACQPTSALAAPINLKSMTAVCRFCGLVYKVEELKVNASIYPHVNGAPAEPSGSKQVN